jgi:hypothetical protein
LSLKRKCPLPTIRTPDETVTGTVICNVCKEMILEVRVLELARDNLLINTIAEHKRYCSSGYGFNILIDGIIR